MTKNFLHNHRYCPSCKATIGQSRAVKNGLPYNLLVVNSGNDESEYGFTK